MCGAGTGAFGVFRKIFQICNGFGIGAKVNYVQLLLVCIFHLTLNK